MSSTAESSVASDRGRPRVLVAIASFGERNIGFLKRIIREYQNMTMDVDIIVLSEAPKDLPTDVTVRVGLPSKNPWSLPFAHKPLFADNVERYDLFIYSEDDIGVTESHLRAFLKATQVLEQDEIAGFLRYEKDQAGATWMPDAHSMFHWEPDSVAASGGALFAKYTNEHSAFYVMTQFQLKKSIASGGFLRAPYEGKYDMLCAAATDPYTSCGLRKMVCISDLDNFIVHHMSDRYAGRMGLPWASFAEQLETLKAIQAGNHPRSSLCAVESRVARGEWSKSFYEQPDGLLLSAIPATCKTVLSIGCGWGAMEAELIRRGADVTALPLDSVIGAAAARVGVKVVYGELSEALGKLVGQTYDCVLITNLLHLQRDPKGLFSRCLNFVGQGGSIVVQSPNFDRFPVLLQRLLKFGLNRGLQDFEESGVVPLRSSMLRTVARRAGMTSPDDVWAGHSLPRAMGLNRLNLRLGRVTAETWIFQATRG